MSITLKGAPQRPWVVVPKVFSTIECQNIIEQASLTMQSNAQLVGGDAHHNIRRCGVSWIDDGAESAFVHDRVVQLVADVNRENFQYDLSEFAEQLQVAHYQGGDKGFYDWHVDRGGKKLASFRKLTMVGLLSPQIDYTGGELQLNANGHVQTLDLDVGDVVLFPSSVLHTVTPVTEGHRYSLAQWVHGPHFR